MIRQLFTRRIAPDRMVHQIVQGTFLLIAAIIFVIGFREITTLDLTPVQAMLGFGIVISLVIQCCTLSVLVDIRRKAP